MLNASVVEFLVIHWNIKAAKNDRNSERIVTMSSLLQMGNYSSEFKNYQGNTVSDVAHPSKGNWITAHATATGCKYKLTNQTQVKFQHLRLYITK